MDRDKQITLLEAGAPRTDRHVADWMADKDVRAALRFYHDLTREAKAPRKVSCACA